MHWHSTYTKSTANIYITIETRQDVALRFDMTSYASFPEKYVII